MQHINVVLSQARMDRLQDCRIRIQYKRRAGGGGVGVWAPAGEPGGRLGASGTHAGGMGCARPERGPRDTTRTLPFPATTRSVVLALLRSEVIPKEIGAQQPNKHQTIEACAALPCTIRNIRMIR